jgi:hypothetical protein
MKKILMILIIGLALAAFSCKESDSPTPHKSTITAFNRTITVKGDASISTDDFNTAKGKLETAMTNLDNDSNGTPSRPAYETMLNRTGFAIIIKTGNASPDADANKSMTIGIDYLLTNDVTPTIVGGIAQKVAGGAFAN